MEANELRIGNIVQGKSLSIPREGIFSDGKTRITGLFISYLEQGIIKTDDYQPIPLTPDILEKCGFEKVKFEQSIRGDYRIGKYHVHLKHGTMCLINSIGMVHHVGKCQHVHQLQNLYFALTGTELNIKL